MKKLLFLLSLLISISGFSQHWNKIYSYNEYLGVEMDSVALPPGDTLASAPIRSFAIKNNHVYQKLSTGIWSQVDGGGNGVQSLTGSQSIQYGPFNSMPAAGTIGRYYAATDSSRWYFDNGITWLNLSGVWTFNARTGAITLLSSDVIGALGYTPLSNLASPGQVAIGNGSGILTPQTVTGDFGFSSSGVGTVNANAITNAKAAQMAANTIKGNNTGSAANQADLSATQVATMLNSYFVQNGGASTKITTGLYSGRPAASNCLCYYVATDSGRLYYDNGGWVTIGGASVNGSIPNFQQTLIAGPNLSKADTINQAGYPLYFAGRGSTVMDSLNLHPLNTFWGADSIINSGNSITLGAASYDGVHGYAFKLDSFFNRPSVNLGTSGAKTAYITQKNYGYEDYTKDLKYGLTVMSGINDIGGSTSAAEWQDVWSGINSMFCNHFAKDTVSCSAGTGVSRFGSLTTYAGKATDGLKATNVLYSNTKNDSVTWNFTDSTFIFFSAATDGNSGAAARYAGGVFKIVIDGVQVARRSINGIADGVADAYYSGHLIPYCVIIHGLSYGTHHVVVSNDSTGGYVYFDCFGNLKDHFSAFPLALFHVTHSNKGAATYLSTDSLNAKLDSMAYATWPLVYPWAIVNSNRNLDTSAAGGMISPSDHLHPLELGHAVIFQNAIDDIFPAPGGLFYSGMDNNPYIVLKNVSAQTGLAGTQPYKVAVGNSIGGTVTAGTIPEGAVGNTLTNSPLTESSGVITQTSPNAIYQLSDNTVTLSRSLIYDYHDYTFLVKNGFGYNPNKTSVGIWFYAPAAGGGSNMQFYVGSANGGLPAQPHMALFSDGNLVVVPNGSGSGAGQEYTGAALQTGGIRPGISFMYNVDPTNTSNFQQLSTGVLKFTNIGPAPTFQFAAPTAGGATVNFPLGTAPTTHNQGDLYPASGHLWYHDGSTDYDLLAGGGASNIATILNSGNQNANATWNFGSFSTKLSGLSTDTTNIAYVLVKGKDSTWRQMTPAQFLSLYGATDTLTAWNGLKQQGTQTNDSIGIGGVLAKNDTIDASANNYSLSLGTVTNPMTTFQVWANRNSFIGGMQYNSMINVGDANYTATTDYFMILPTPTASRTLTLPTPNSTQQGRTFVVANRNTSGSFTWSFASGQVVDATGAAITTMANNTVYQLICDNTHYVKIN